jgi:AAA+ superfamily predicted ATPase
MATDTLVVDGRVHRGAEPGPAAAALASQLAWLLPEDVVSTMAREALPRQIGAMEAERRRSRWRRILATHPGWSWLQTRYGLSESQLDLLLVALAPELPPDTSCRIAAWRSDGRTARPTVALMARVIPHAPSEPSTRDLLGGDGVLRKERLVRLVPDPRDVEPPSTDLWVVLDPQVVDVLLRRAGLDERLRSCATLARPPAGRWSSTTVADDAREQVLEAARASVGRREFRVNFHGPAGSGRRTAARALAGELGVPVLSVDAGAAVAVTGDARSLADLLDVVVREAELHGALLLVHGIEPASEVSPHRGRMLASLDRHRGLLVLAGADPWAGGPCPGVVDVSLEDPGPERRRRYWTEHLAAVGADPQLAGELAERFHLLPGAVADVVAIATTQARGTAPGAADLHRAARTRTAGSLASLAVRVEPRYGWDQLVLPDEARGQLRDLCRRVTHGRTVWQDWGFEAAFPRSRGLAALFAGPSGTGKTMAGEVVAHQVGLDLYTVDLSTVVSKYIGETEKNLERIFDAAAHADAILMFDEAEALFGKRSEVRDAHDRYANIETAYLLQRMERHQGVAILATNLRHHLDEAFLRRLQFVVEFPFPDAGLRHRLWEVALPDRAPRAADIDLEALARKFRLTGGHIRNVVLHAAFLAAHDGQSIHARHVDQAIRNEYRKLGRPHADPDDQAGG